MRLKESVVVAVLLSVLSIGVAFAQKVENITVQGVVTSKDGTPLMGVSIYTKDFKKGTTSDENGKYTLSIEKGRELKFCYIGFECKEVKVTSSQLNIVLKEEVETLNDVVVTGYKKTQVRKSTGSVSIVKAEQLKSAPLENVDNLLKGKLAGVKITRTSGRPGASAKVRIRGTSTITGNAEPLWVVDGVPLQKDVPKNGSRYVRTNEFTEIFANGIGGINPSDIESITVLKDASSAAIYGSRAASGVIVITTKKGKSGKMQINYSNSISLQKSPSRDPNLMNATEKIEYEKGIWDEFSRKGYLESQRGISSYYPVVGLVGMVRSGYGEFATMSFQERENYLAKQAEQSTDWFDSLFDDSVSVSHYLSLSGGSDKVVYYVSGGYNENNGIVQKTNYDSYSLNAKINFIPNSKISFGLKTDFSYQKSLSPSINVDPFKYAYFANPYEKPYHTDGSYSADRTYFMLTKINSGGIEPLPENGYNIFREINETELKNSSASTNISGNVDWNFSKDFKFSGMASISYTSDQADNINGKSTYAAFTDRPFDDPTSKRTYGSIAQNMMYNFNYMLRGQLDYNKTLNGIHLLSGLVGSEIRSSYSKGIFSKRYGYDPVSGNSAMPTFQPSSLGVKHSDLVRYADIMNNLQGQSITENAFASFYGAFDYIYDSKYILNMSARTDGSNNFGSEEQFNATWAVGLAWNIDQEKFFKPLSQAIDRMTLKMATGYTGGVNKSVYPVFIMDYDPNFRITNNNFYRKGTIRNAPNPHLRWEKTQDFKVALDMSMFNNHLQFLIESYYRRNFDLVTPVLVPSTTGFVVQSYNTSEQINKGVEVSLSGSIVRTEDFNISLSTNIAYNYNELTKYESPTGSVLGDHYVGYPLGKIFTGIPTGINPDTGIYNYQIRPDAVINNPSDHQKFINYFYYVGTSFAPYSGGISLNTSYKNFTLSVGADFSIGAKVLNRIEPPFNSYSIDKSGNKEPIPTSKNDLYVGHFNREQKAAYRWTQDNPITNGYPRLIDRFGSRMYLDRDQPTNDLITKSVFLEDASYLKINSISLIYNFPQKYLSSLKIRSISASLTMNNLFTLTNYSGIDPETPGAVYPQSRVFSTGFNIGF